jgi:hypothetical protein
VDEIVVLIIVFSIPSVLVLIDFIRYLAIGKRLLGPILTKILEIITVVGLPFFYLSILDFGLTNDCCHESATFSPDHRLTIYTLIIFCVAAFFYTTHRSKLAPPIIEVILNSFLLIGITLNIVLLFHIEMPVSLLGNIAIIMLFVRAMIENQKAVFKLAQENKLDSESGLSGIAWTLLTLKPVYKYPILMVLTLPLVFLLTAVLMLFGQKPDSAIKAFTDTYKHGLSQWDHLCDNVICGGHYLCSVAANGHQKVVRPKRFGIRKGGLIICNRQLLISNAFEDVIQKKFPKLHKVLRNNYNKVGAMIHKHYHIFERKHVSDLVYVLMKPLEWVFIIFLYTVDRNPENRIAVQYLSISDREAIARLSK